MLVHQIPHSDFCWTRPATARLPSGCKRNDRCVRVRRCFSCHGSELWVSGPLRWTMPMVLCGPWCVAIFCNPLPAWG